MVKTMMFVLACLTVMKSTIAVHIVGKACYNCDKSTVSAGSGKYYCDKNVFPTQTKRTALRRSFFILKEPHSKPQCGASRIKTNQSNVLGGKGEGIPKGKPP